MKELKAKLNLYYNDTVNFFVETLTRSSTKEGFIKYFKNTGWLFLGRMSSLIASFFVGAYVARYLGPAEYGLLNYASSFTGLFAVFASFGIDSILSRELVSHPEKKEELLGSGILIKTVGAIFSIFLIIITLFIIKTDKLTNVLIFISSLLFITNIFGIIDIYFQSQVLAKKTVKIQIISLIITSILKLILIFFKFGLIYFALVYIIDGIIIAFGLIFASKKIGVHFSNWKIDKSIVKMLIKDSWPMMFSGVAIAIYMKIDQVMIKNMLGNESAGLYSVAAKVSEVWYFIPAIICASLFPAIVNARETDKAIYEKRLKSLYSLMFYISIGIAIPITLMSGFIITSLFGAEYVGSISVLKIHIWAGIGVFLGYAVAQYLIVENKIKIFFYTTILGALVNIFLNILLIPKFGIIGSAYSTLISYTTQTFSIIFFKKTRKQGTLIIKSITNFKGKNK